MEVGLKTHGLDPERLAVLVCPEEVTLVFRFATEVPSARPPAGEVLARLEIRMSFRSN